nr:Membrane-associated protein uidC precursor [Citrobacter werkmanii]
MNKITRLTAIAIAVASVCTSVLAEQISDDEAALRFRLKMSCAGLTNPAPELGRIYMPGCREGLLILIVVITLNL